MAATIQPRNGPAPEAADTDTEATAPTPSTANGSGATPAPLPQAGHRRTAPWRPAAQASCRLVDNLGRIAVERLRQSSFDALISHAAAGEGPAGHTGNGAGDPSGLDGGGAGGNGTASAGNGAGRGEGREVAAAAEATALHLAVYGNVQEHLAEAVDPQPRLHGSARLLAWARGTAEERVSLSCSAAQARLVLLWSDDQLSGALPRLLTTIRHYLPETDGERMAVDRRFPPVDPRLPVGPTGTQDERTPFTRVDRELLSSALTNANLAAAAERDRFRRFRNVLLSASVVVLGLIGALCTLGALNPDALPLCFPDPNVAEVEVDAAAPPVDAGGQEDVVAAIGQVCPTGHSSPTGGDVPLVVLLGLVGAALTGVRSVTRTAPPTLRPLGGVRILQALFKASIGMLGALLGLMFLRAGVVPGFTSLDTQSEILVYAIVFGAAQDLFTRLVDSRANDLSQASTPAEAGGSLASAGAQARPVAETAV
jgi:hypothetical protein